MSEQQTSGDGQGSGAVVDEWARMAAEFAMAPLDVIKRTAIDLGLSVDPTDTHEEIVARVLETIRSRREAAEAAAAAVRRREEDEAARAAFYKTKDGKKRRELEECAARNDAVRRVHGEFIRALPAQAIREGVHVVEPEDRQAGEYPVQDGGYRVLGSDWVMRFKGGKWAGADRAHARAEPDWIEIPDAEPPLPALAPLPANG